MSWKVQSVLQQRLAMIHRIEELKRPVHEVAKEFGVSRKTANKWLARHRGKQWCALLDQSHRPRHSPDKTPDSIEETIAPHRSGALHGADKRESCTNKATVSSNDVNDGDAGWLESEAPARPRLPVLERACQAMSRAPAGRAV